MRYMGALISGSGHLPGTLRIQSHLANNLALLYISIQEPVTVKLGDSGDIRESGRDTFQYVPLLPGLNSLLQNPYIFEEVSN